MCAWKDCVEVVLAVVGSALAIWGFRQTLKEWRVGQRWRRSEQLDKLIDHFESDPQLHVARMVLDWTVRTVKTETGETKITNNDVLLALRDHAMGVDDFPGAQAPIRDAIDAFLSFLARLETGLSNGLIDVEPTKGYFRYWIERFVTMDKHPLPEKGSKERRDVDADLKGHLPEELFKPGEEATAAKYLVAGYVDAYGERRILDSLCEKFGVKLDWPEPEA